MKQLMIPFVAALAVSITASTCDAQLFRSGRSTANSSCQQYYQPAYYGGYATRALFVPRQQAAYNNFQQNFAAQRYQLQQQVRLVPQPYYQNQWVAQPNLYTANAWTPCTANLQAATGASPATMMTAPGNAPTAASNTVQPATFEAPSTDTPTPTPTSITAPAADPIITPPANDAPANDAPAQPIQSGETSILDSDN